MAYDKVKTGDTRFDDTAFFYKITGRFTRREPKLFYIGKTYSQTVSMRLNQTDHKARCARLKSEYPRHSLSVSLGLVEVLNGNVTDKRIDQVESILIYAHDSVHLINEKKVVHLDMREHYLVENAGYAAPLFKKIQFGLFASWR